MLLIHDIMKKIERSIIMKKIIALFAVATVLCSFASCGQDPADEVSEESSVTSVSEVSEEETTEEITESGTETDEVPEESSATSVSEVSEEETTEEITESETEEANGETTGENAEYQELMEKYFEYVANKDVDSIIKLSYPDKYCDTVKTLYETGIIEPPCLDFLNTIGFTNFTLVSIDSAETLAQDYISLFNGGYAQFQTISDYIEQNGTENTDELKKVTEEAYTDPHETYFHVENVITLTCTLSREPTDDSLDDSEYEKFIDYEFILYYIDGEGWKIDFWYVPSLYGMEKEALKDEVQNIYTSAENLPAELELPENCIISTDSSKNYNVDDETADTFINSIKEYYQPNDILNYFVLIENGEISCVVGIYDGKPKSIWAFPSEYMYDEENYVILSYDENYQMHLDRIK